MKIHTKRELLPIALILVSFAAGLYLYPSLPNKIPMHWNVNGEINGWSGKKFGVLFFPAITLFIYLLMTFLPLIDPLKENYIKFDGAYFWMRTAFVLSFVLLYLFTLGAAIGVTFLINYFIIPAISALFISIGVILPKIRRNWFVGIRTPWTIHSDEVWDKTHELSGKLFISTGVVSFLSVLFLVIPRQLAARLPYRFPESRAYSGV